MKHIGGHKWSWGFINSNEVDFEANIVNGWNGDLQAGTKSKSVNVEFLLWRLWGLYSPRETIKYSLYYYDDKHMRQNKVSHKHLITVSYIVNTLRLIIMNNPSHDNHANLII